MPPVTDFRDYIRDHILIGDGAMTTWLHQNGVPIGVCAEEMCLSRPQLISDSHRRYYEAGARLIETNTFAANREMLAGFALESSVYAINWKATGLAREAAGDDAYIFGSMTAVTGGGMRSADTSGHPAVFREQAEALLAGGVDGLILETFLDLEELLLAVETLRPLTLLPIIAQLACIEIGRTRDGYTLTEAFSALKKSGADVVGLNCRLGPFEIVRSLDSAFIDPALPISVFPNAGRLSLSDGEYGYTASPDYFAEQALLFREQGVRILGGCCGTTAEHIRKIAEALAGTPPVPRKNPSPTQVAEMHPVPVLQVKPRETIVDRVARQRTVIVEFDPPRDLNIDEFLKGAANLQNAGADAITMADNSLAQARMSNLALGAILKSKLGIDPVVHITCRDRNLLGQQSHLMGLDALDIHHILIITGDPPRYGDMPGASPVYDVSSFELIRMVRQFNEGISFSGKRLADKGSFVVGAAFNPYVSNIENAVNRLEKKVRSGADFVVTQPMYDQETIELVRRIAEGVNIPFFISIMPLVSSRNAEFLHNEVPGIRLSDEVRELMRQCSGAAEARQEGIRIAKELIDAALQYFRGICLMTPFMHHEMTAELTRYIKKA
jgi:homocysteine S-methyltransferase